jgi:cytoskeletal protein CcmA (bactofilin family)
MANELLRPFEIHSSRGIVMSLFIKPNPSPLSSLIIGPAMTIKGTIHSKTDVFLDGVVEGELNVEGNRLTIGPHGQVLANAKAREMDIQGIITGNVETTGTTSIRESGKLVGDVRTGGILIELGAVVKGTIEIVCRSKSSPLEPGSEAVDGR